MPRTKRPTTLRDHHGKDPAERASAQGKCPYPGSARYAHRPGGGGRPRYLRGVNGLLADVFALYMKAKNFHWHMSGPHFRDYHLLLYEHGGQLFAMTDPLAERARKVGGATLRSIGHIARQQRIPDNDAEYVEPKDMLAELGDDYQKLVAKMRQVHNVCDNMAMWRLRACLKSGSTRPSGAPGSCSRRHEARRARTPNRRT
jgi:DNA-binding ferritin-like protein